MIGRGAIGRPNIFAEIKVGLGWEKEENLPGLTVSGFNILMSKSNLLPVIGVGIDISRYSP